MAEGITREDLAALLAAERRITDEQVARLDQASTDAKERAALAYTSAAESKALHNDLIRKGEQKESLFATRDEVGLIRDEQALLRSSLAKVAGAAAVIAVMASFIIRLAGIG